MKTNAKLTRIREFYDAEAERYLDERYVGETLEPVVAGTRKQIVLDMMRGEQGRVLDIGCGPGILTAELAEMGFTLVSADVSKNMLLEAQNTVGSSDRLFWVQCGLEALPFPANFFSHIIMIGVLGLAADTDMALSEARRVLRPGGQLITQAPNSLSPTKLIHRYKHKITDYFGAPDRLAFERRLRRNKIDPKAHTYSSFRRILHKAGFESVEVRFYDFRLPLHEYLPKSVGLPILRTSQRLLTSSPMGWLGEAYVVRTKKTNTDS